MVPLGDNAEVIPADGTVAISLGYAVVIPEKGAEVVPKNGAMVIPAVMLW